MTTLGAVGHERAATFVGRAAERAFLARLLDDDGPVVAFVHRRAGIGKSSLLAVFAAEVDVPVVVVDGEAIEPTEAGFLRALHADTCTPADAAARIGERVIAAVDGYERLRLLDDWLRRVFVPALPEHAHLAVFGRDAPVPAWSRAVGPLLAARELDSLAPQEALALLARLGVSPGRAESVNRVLRGHPLSLRLAAATGTVAAEPAFDELTRIYLHGLPAGTRIALDAASVVRRVTAGLLTAMLGPETSAEALERLRALPFVAVTHEGVVIHHVLREAVAAELATSDRARHRQLRAAAWRQLRDELAVAADGDRWRHTADMLYLLENPAVRDAFFPASAPMYTVEPARANDAPAIAAITERHEPAAGAALARIWWDCAPDSFSVARDAAGEVAGFSVVCELGAAPACLFDRDPVADVWRADLRAQPLARGERALLVRFMCGERPAPEVASLLLDLTRSYLALRPALRRVYTCVSDPAMAATIEPLGFAALDGESRLDGVPYRCLCNDFGPGSVDGWITRLAAHDALAGSVPLLDPDEHHLVVDGRPIALTPLEFRVLWTLHQHTGTVVRRAALIEEVWGTSWDNGGDPLGSAIKGVRRKLGAHSGALETVRGIGYRLRPLA